MFHLTPQEKSALSVLVTVCLLGTMIHCALYGRVKAVAWVDSAAHKSVVTPPDINTATAEQLDRVPGIGLKTAQNIVAYRTLHGPFETLVDLHKVKGITKKSYLKIVEFYHEGPHEQSSSLH